MTHSLLLLLKGPLQSWADASRYSTRATAERPTKSGIIGLLAAAEGRRRTDPVEDLTALKFAVRVDQSGRLLRDYQTAHPWQSKPTASAKLSTRYFLSDAAFVVAIESNDKELLEGMAEALRNPKFPLFMGRRSCPVHPGLVIGVTEHDAETSLRKHKTWYATKNHQEQSPKTVYLAIYRDAEITEEGAEARQDIPISFDPQHRQYGWRGVLQCEDVVLDNPAGSEASSDPDRFFEAVLRA